MSSLISAFGLDGQCELVPISRADFKTLSSFHTKHFVEALLRSRPDIDVEHEEHDKIRSMLGIEDTVNENSFDFSSSDESYKISADFGLLYDCPLFPFLSEYVRWVAGSSISAANALLRPNTFSQLVAINWYGGRHHCLKDRAAGFCYVNDVVLAILRLRSKYKSVFYLDLDLHHGDGVERAFEFSKYVSTCSIHRYDVGFYPGTGGLDSSRKNKFNIPTKRGLSDENMLRLVKEIVFPLIERVLADAIVIQAGCDGLAMDSHGEWNMTIKGYSQAVVSVIQQFSDLPVLVLGGGGYNNVETAKCWAHITKEIVGDTSTWVEIPEHENSDAYEPDSYQFWANVGPKVGRREENTKDIIEGIKMYLNSV